MDWMETAETAFGCAIAASLGLDPDSSAAADFVRYTDRLDDDAPRPKRSKDVCYIAVSPRNGLYWAASTVGEESTTIDKTLPVAAQVVFYGPAATANAERARTLLLMDRTHGSGRMWLEKAGIYLDGAINPPVQLHEQEDGGWRRRCDLTLNATMLWQEAFTSGHVAHAPDVDIVKN